MASLADVISGSTPIQSPADKFYNFFKYSFSELAKIFPAGFTVVQLIEGTAGTVGSVYLIKYILGVVTLTAKLAVEAIDDAAKSITFNCVEGEVLELYSTFKSTLTVSDGSAKWSFTYEKRTLIAPPPELYITFAITMSTVVDAYLLLINN